MKKIIVIGCPGSGKSYFSKELQKITGLPLYHLDMMFWNADKTTVDKSTFMTRLNNVLKAEEWIIDGNYVSTMELRVEACDTVFFLDYPTDICLDGVKERLGKSRSDMPWIENTEDADFVDFIKSFSETTRPKIVNILQRYRNKSVFIFADRKEANEFLEKKKCAICK